MNRTAIILAFLAATSICVAQTPTITLTAKNTTPNGTKGYTMFLGANRSATLGVDSSMQEIEIPTIPLPSGVFYVWTSVDLPSGVSWLSPRDIRYLSPGSQYREDYDLTVNWDGGTLKWTWLTPLPELVDSAWIVDGYTDYPDNVAKAKLVPGSSLDVSNPSLKKFRLLVWYNTTTLAVAESPTAQCIVAPQPCREYFAVRSEAPIRSYTLYDMQGMVVEGGMAQGLEIRQPVAHLAPSTYVLELSLENGSTQRTLLIKY